jgi:hypothetical protein
MSPRARARGRRQCLLAAGGVVDRVRLIEWPLSPLYTTCANADTLELRAREREMDVWQYAVSVTHTHISLQPV